MRHIYRSVLILALAAAVPACGGGGGGGGGGGTPVVLVSESLAGVDGNGDSDQQSMTPDGRYIAFRSAATNLLPAAETLAFTDIYRKDMVTGTVVRVSNSTTAGEPNSHSRNPAISADGNLIAYVSTASNIVAGTFAGTTQTNV